MYINKKQVTETENEVTKFYTRRSKEMKKTIKRILTAALAIILFASTGMTTAQVDVMAASTATMTTGVYYTIKNVGSGKYLNVYGSKSASNTNITVYQSDGTTGQQFKLAKNSTYNGYTIIPKCATSCAVNVYGTKASSKANVCTWTKTGSKTQTWVFKSVSDGYIICCADNTDYVLTATGSSNSSNVNIQKYSSSNKMQVWTLTKVSTDDSKITTADIQKVLDKYNYVTGRYWTYASGGSSTKGYKSSTRANSKYSYSYNGVQCKGFADFVMSQVTGTNVSASTSSSGKWKSYSASKVTSLKVGDIVRIGKSNNDGHSAVVLSVDSSGKCTFAQCFGNCGCKISIGTAMQSTKYGTHSTLKSMKNAGVLLYVYRYEG